MRVVGTRIPTTGEDRKIYSTADSTASTNQTVFAVNYDEGKVACWLNGIRLVQGQDFSYTASGIGSQITLSSGIAANDYVEVVGYQGIYSGNALVEDRFVIGTSSTGSGGSYTNSTTVLPVANNTGDLVCVYRNGIKLVHTTDFVVSASGNTVTLQNAANTADEITVHVIGILQHSNFVSVTGGTFTGNVGIGASPAQTLHVKTSTSATPITFGVLSNSTGLPAISLNGAYASTTMAGIYGNGATASNLYYTAPSGKDHIFSIADVPKMVIDDSGNVGIGLTSPATNAHIYKDDSGGTVALRIENADNSAVNSYAQLNLKVGGTSGGDPRILWEIPSGNTWYAGVDNNASDKFWIGTSATASGFVLDTSGNVGIGTASPNRKFEVQSDGGQVRISDTDGSYGEIFTNAGDYNFRATGNGGTGTIDGYMTFDVTNSGTTSEAMRIDSSGNVGIGTTASFGGSTTTHKYFSILNTNGTDNLDRPAVLELACSNKGNGVHVGKIDFWSDVDGGDDNVGTIICAQDGTTSNNVGGKFRFQTKADGGSLADRMVIDQAGRVGINTGSPISRVHIHTNATDTIPTNPLAQNTDNNVVTVRNENNSANYSGLKLEVRTSGASAWLIANEWKSQYLGDLVFRNRDGGTTSAERMRIHSSGEVTMPHQPAVRAFTNPDFTANGMMTGSNWSTSTSNSTGYDNNNDFSQGTFTAPVDGVYLTSVIWDARSVQSRVYLRKNTTVSIVLYEPTGRTDDIWETHTWTTTVKLSSGDTLKLEAANAGGSHPFHMPGDWGSWSITLLC